ncbi:MAG: hypothetical protein GXP18_11325 [Gammaproteobacteria bacterium]|nr:hypothetical protein [Gammaproteobacteria bacterium]
MGVFVFLVEWFALRPVLAAAPAFVCICPVCFLWYELSLDVFRIGTAPNHVTPVYCGGLAGTGTESRHHLCGSRCCTLLVWLCPVADCVIRATDDIFTE